MLDALTFQRAAHLLHIRRHKLAARVVTRLARHLFGTYLAPETEIGAGTELGYGGIGIVIHKDARLGRDVLVAPGVVIGGRSGLPGAPDIADRVKIGAGAKVLGPIKIGEGAFIGANAVVIHDVAPGDVVVGIPARPIERRLKVVEGGEPGAASG
ncbi:MAG: serine acetyltransferase [Myxococcales bacterium]|nr:serine acetyltransferase [Myxococcales bacterium]